MDEPTAGLDPKGAKQLIELFIDLNKTLKKTIILVTHDNEMVYNYADETVLLSKGKVVYHGSTLELFNNTDMIKEYGLLEPQIVTFRNLLIEKGFRLSDKARTLDVLAEEVRKQLK